MAGNAPRRRQVMQVTWSLVAGGSERYAFTIASHLDATKFSSALCAVDQGGALESLVRERGIPYRIMDRRPGIQLTLMGRLARVFRAAGVAVVHTHHFNQLFYSALGARLAGARLIHTEHSVECYERPRLRLALRFLALFCERVVAIGGEVRDVLEHQVGIPARKLLVIPAGIDVSSFREERSVAREALGLCPADRVAVIVARLSPEKNHRLLLDAFAEVVRRVEGARLLIVGDGSERDAIRSEIARRGLDGSTHMLGVRHDVARVLAAADVFVLSSDREGLPIAALEAMAAARPVVVTAVGDLPGVVREGGVGLVVPPRDAASLAASLAELLGDPERAATMGSIGRALVEKQYSLRAMIERHEALYSEKRVEGFGLGS
jgi:glycosyltransferase involved in cell wall biosynthesis